MAQVTALKDGIRDDDVHLASEVSQELGLYAVILKFDIMQATVLAVSIFANDLHLYGACPFVISGTCKQEEVPSQRELLQNVCRALAQKIDDIGCRLYSLASDGDSRQRRATAMLSLIHELEHDLDLRNQLADLALFNFLCGIDDETTNIDYKCILKQL